VSVSTGIRREKPKTKRRILATGGRRDDWLYAVLFLAPTVFIISLVIFYPLVRVLSYSVHNTHLMMPQNQQFIALDNFTQIFRDAIFKTAVVNTLVFTLASVAGGFLIGFVLALLLNEAIPARNLWRGAALIPWVVPGVIVSLLTLYMFNGAVGIVNHTLKTVGLIEEFIPWFGSTKHAMWALVAANVWNQTPFYMLMLLAGLQSRSDELMEAAKIDGAGMLGRFRYITLPHLFGIILIVTSLMVIWNFNSFDLFWATTQGGPVNATMTLSVYTYRQAFLAFRMGYASAISVLWLLGLLAFSTVYIRAMEGANNV
jgi:multiple sugar transport system permease protein